MLTIMCYRDSMKYNHDDINEDYENNLTLEYMQKYGWQNVRGGYYTRLVIKKPNQIK